MKKLFLILLVVPFFINSASVIKPGPPSSEAVLKEAFGQATRENKKVLIIFHASWCGWCHKTEASLNDPMQNKEVAYFDKVLKTTTYLKEADITVIHNRFLLNQEPTQPVPSGKK